MDNLRLPDETFHCPRCEETKPIPDGTSALEHIRCKACGNTTMAHHWRRANEPTSADIEAAAIHEHNSGI